jgi:hypothetical protein
MITCPICKKPIEAHLQTVFVVKKVAYHEACIPDCENCGKPIPFERTCDSVWTEQNGNAVICWKARHKLCY